MSRAKLRKRVIGIDDLDDINESLPQEQAKNVKRQLRKPLLNALDVYDKNVSKGRIAESEEEKQVVDGWYKRICDLEDDAFKHIPVCVGKYEGA